jgi:hypothetical protein
MTDSPTTPDQEFELVYQGICSVAARCDGAQTEDGVGFNGQDTHFGRRIALVPLSEWTIDVKVEAARIANRYQTQILTYTDIDVTTLEVVKAALGKTTNHQARDDARGYERKAKGAAKLAERKIDVVDGDLGIFYAKKDPEFDALLVACKALPGRSFNWDRKCNVVPASEAVEDFVLAWDFPLTDAAVALLQAPRAEFFHVTLADNGQKVIIETPYDAALVEAIKTLPGRAYKGGSLNTADINLAVVKLVDRFGLKIHPDARAACEHAQEALEASEAAALAAEDLKTVMAHVSRQKDPQALPPVFLDLLAHVLPPDVAEKVIIHV